MPKSLSELTDALFSQIDRLNRDELSDEQLEQECKRGETMKEIADSITGVANVQLRAAKLYADHGAAVLSHLPQIGKAANREGEK